MYERDRTLHATSHFAALFSKYEEMSIPELRFRVYGANLDKEFLPSGGNGTFRLKANLGDMEENFADVAFKMEVRWRRVRGVRG